LKEHVFLATVELVSNVTYAASHQACHARRWRADGGWRIVGAALAFAALPLGGTAVAQEKEAPQVQTPPAGGVANLPFARGRSFHTLDEYLAHLEALGAVGLPWWREIRPGVYERVTNLTEAPREVATHAELERRFGFKR